MDCIATSTQHVQLMVLDGLRKTFCVYCLIRFQLLFLYFLTASEFFTLKSSYIQELKNY